MKKKLILSGIIILLLGLVAFGYWTISPLFLNVRVSEVMPGLIEIIKDGSKNAPPMAVTLSGGFIGVENHSAEGMIKLVSVGDKKYIRFEDNFKVTNGPDLFVYLGKDGQYDAAANLGSLKGNIGSQNYEIPAGIDLTKYNEVWVWCRAFSVGFGVAKLK